MKVWRDYRVTIPAKIRRELGLHPGTELDYAVENDEIVLFKKVSPPSERKKPIKPSRKKMSDLS